MMKNIRLEVDTGRLDYDIRRLEETIAEMKAKIKALNEALNKCESEDADALTDMCNELEQAVCGIGVLCEKLKNARDKYLMLENETSELIASVRI